MPGADQAKQARSKLWNSRATGFTSKVREWNKDKALVCPPCLLAVHAGKARARALPTQVIKARRIPISVLTFTAIRAVQPGQQVDKG
jgi:hypothetical protein